MTILCAIAWLPVTMALVYLAREAEVADPFRIFVVSKAERSSLARFIVSMLNCAPCTSAWVAPASAFGLWWLSGEPMGPREAILCLVVAPLAAVGALWMVTILSPLEAFGFLSARSKEGKSNGQEGKGVGAG